VIPNARPCVVSSKAAALVVVVVKAVEQEVAVVVKAAVVLEASVLGNNSGCTFLNTQPPFGKRGHLFGKRGYYLVEVFKQGICFGIRTDY
jgi:hypothetical protein